MNPWPGYEFLYLAEQKGFFEKVGANIRLVQMSSLSDGQRAYVGGRVDGICGTMIEAVQASFLSEESLKIIMVTDYSNGGDVILANTSISKLADLQGKTVGAEINSLGIFVLQRALELSGMTLADVNVVNVEQLYGEQAMKNGELDAFVSYPPVSVSLLKDEGVSKIFSSADIPREVIDIVALNENVLSEKPELVSQLRDAWQMALDYTKTNPEDAVAIMAEREGISVDDFKSALDEVVILSKDDQEKLFENSDELQKSAIAVCRTLHHVGVLEADCNKFPNIIYKL
jgi:NitT/TauT family transport system substrate-binding protein